MDRPPWLSDALYPFDSQYFESSDGRMHYVDEGSGHPVLMVHGTPTWSFLYRDLVESVAQEHRAIAVDHLGFGLSAKPEDAGYRPAEHAQRLTAFIDELEVERFTLVVHDFGGPIGLSYALQRPEQIDRLVLFNTWLWSLKDSLTARLVSLLMRGMVGRLFHRRYNGSPRLLLKAAWGDETLLSDDVHRHYRDPFPTAADRTAPLVLARELIDSTDWYRSLWEQRSNIVDKPTLVMWGLQDPTFGESVLERWEDSLSAPQVHRLPAVGHFVPDEAADTVIPKLIEFIDES